MRAALLAILVCASAVACSTGQPAAAGAKKEGAPAQQAPGQKQVFEVLEEPKSGAPAHIGKVTVDAQFRLQIVSATPERKRFLSETLGRINGKTELFAQMPPPAGAPRYAVASTTVPRSSPDFWPELQVYLKQYYGLILKPVAE